MLRRWEVLLYNMVLTTELINKCKLAHSKEFLRLTFTQLPCLSNRPSSHCRTNYRVIWWKLTKLLILNEGETFNNNFINLLRKCFPPSPFFLLFFLQTKKQAKKQTCCWLSIIASKYLIIDSRKSFTRFFC